MKTLVHACDNGRYYYGDIDNDLIGDSTDLEGRLINGKYYISFLPDDPDDDAYEITVEGASSYSMGVYQDNGSAVAAVEINGMGRYLPSTANEIIIEIESSTPGSQIDVFVNKFAR